MQFIKASAILTSAVYVRADLSYLSPDNLVRATVVNDRNGESVTRFEDVKSARVLYSKDDRSNDGSHGRRIVHAQWTEDGGFFAAASENTGGHQPSSRPIWVYSRYENRVVELWGEGLFAVSDFHLSYPNALRVRVQGSSPDLRNQPVCRNLSDFFPEDKRIRVASIMGEGKLIHHVRPEYPAALKRRHVSGVVRFNALIQTDGQVKQLSLVTGPALLVPYAEKAVRQWRYERTTIGCTAVQVKTTIDVSFTLSQ